MEQNLKHLLLQITEINKRFGKEAELTGENFNVFRILKLESSENRLHSAFLTELLNPKGTHGHQDNFLKLFLKRTLKNNTLIEYETANAKANQEESFGSIDELGTSGGRVDICIRDANNNLILIENKIYAGDQLNQLIRYHQRAPKALFYLTLDGKIANKTTAGNLEEGLDYFAISYKDDIIHWLEDCRKEAAMQPILRESITQYINLIKYLTNQTINEMKETNISEILLDNAENLKSAFAIQRAIHGTKSLLITRLKNEIEQLAKNLNLEYDFDDNISKPYAGFSLYSKTWKYTGLGFEFEKSNMNDLIYGFYHKDIRDDDRIILHKAVKKELAGRASKTWSYFRYLEIKDWEIDERAWVAIANGEMIKLIAANVKDLLEKTRDIQHQF